ncbi:tyrosine-protein kinase TXK-like [Ptychodera flava]|uniref:tyrosine-protein kinase TXK-like n=1 Tax=Ptychodera flava TaxID=63121 RepID=UPI00396A4731
MPFFQKKQDKGAKRHGNAAKETESTFYTSINPGKDAKEQSSEIVDGDGANAEPLSRTSQLERQLEEVAAKEAYTEKLSRSAEERRKLLDYSFQHKLGQGGFEGKDTSEILRGFYINIGLFGLPGAGKSSFIDTVETCLRKVSKADRKTMFVKNIEDAIEVTECLAGLAAFKLFDTKGFGQNLRDDESHIFRSIIEGGLKARSSLRPEDADACADSPLSERMHSMVCFVNPMDPSLHNGSLEQYLKPFKDVLRSVGINPVCVVTHSKKIANETQNLKIMSEVIRATGSNKDRVFFINNHTTGNAERNPDTELAVFSILNCALACAETHVKSKLKSRERKISQSSPWLLAPENPAVKSRASFSDADKISRPSTDDREKYSNTGRGMRKISSTQAPSSPDLKRQAEQIYKSRKPLPPTPKDVQEDIKARPHSDTTEQNQATLAPTPTQRACQVVVALEDYSSRQTGDLSLQSGMEYLVLDDSGSHFWKARDKHGNTGFLNRDLVMDRTEFHSRQLAKFPWFYKEVGQEAAEKRLKEESQDGTFLVRPSSNPGHFTLSLLTIIEQRKAVYHYSIKSTSDNKCYIIKDHIFPDIPQLVEYHQLNGGGLITRLRMTAHNFQDSLELDPSTIVMMQELGSGQFSVVRLGRLQDGRLAAVKMMKKESWSINGFMEEVTTMRKLRHKNLVSLVGVCTRNPPYFLVMEYMSQGCLLKYLQKHSHLLNRSEIPIHICIQVCSAMEYLESTNFIHRDLAARNCLVGDNISVKVADFGLTRYVIDDEYIPSWGTKFPVRWAPPEVLLKNKFSSKSDVWSFGILMWEIYTGGGQPYGSMTNIQYIHEVTEKGYRLTRPVKCLPQIYNVMLYCWKADPNDRPTFHELSKVLQGFHNPHREPQMSLEMDI